MFIKAVSCIFSSHFTYSPWVISSQFHNFWFLVFPGHTIPLCHTSHTYLPIRYLFLSDSLEPQTCVQKLNLSFIFFPKLSSVLFVVVVVVAGLWTCFKPVTPLFLPLSPFLNENVYPMSHRYILEMDTFFSTFKVTWIERNSEVGWTIPRDSHTTDLRFGRWDMGLFQLIFK